MSLTSFTFPYSTYFTSLCLTVFTYLTILVSVPDLTYLWCLDVLSALYHLLTLLTYPPPLYLTYSLNLLIFFCINDWNSPSTTSPFLWSFGS